MKKITSQKQYFRVFLLSLLLLSGLPVSGQPFIYDDKFWNQDYMNVKFDRTKNAFVIKMMFFDYRFRLRTGDYGYLESCKFEFSDNGVDYYTLMKANAPTQREKDWSYIFFTNKYPGAQISFFYEMHKRAHQVDWKNDKDLRLEIDHPNKKHEAWVTFNWYMNADFYNIRTIRIIGKWATTGRAPAETFNYIAYDSKKQLKSKTKFVSTKVIKPFAADTIVAKVTKQADAIVVSGAKAGDNIEVTTIAGQNVQTTVALSDVVKIKVPANQVYLVRVGEANYKVAM